MTEPNLSLGRAASAAEGDLRLPKPPGVVRQFWGRHPRWTDSIIAAIYGLPVILASLTLTVAAGPRPGGWFFGVLGPVLAVISIAAVLFRRRTPLIALSVTIGCTFLTMSSHLGFLGVGVMFALYAVAAHHSNRASWIGLGCAVTAMIIGGLLPFPRPLTIGEASQQVLTFGLLMLLATLIGVNIGNRARYVLALIDRAQQLARERDQQARLSAAAERTRIAREMHDIVSHSLTVMVSLADGSAALAEAEPERAEHAMSQVAQTGRHALTDMRRMLGVLNDADRDPRASDLEPQPGASDLDELADRLRSAGMPLRFSVTGGAPDDAALQLTVYRVAQESLTNVLRHAPDATRVDASVVYGEGCVTVQIDDDGHGFGASGEGANRRLVGMRERVGLYGGTVNSGHRSAGGWRVLATIPRSGATR